MKYRVLVLPIVFLSCLSAPEFERDNTFDRDAGIPYIHNFKYRLNQSSIVFSWIDGSSDNDVFLLTQKMYDLDGNNDSLILEYEIDPERVFYNENSQKLGYPYEVILTSIIYDGNSGNIRKSISDSISINFGTISFFTKRIVGDSFRINWRNSSISHFVENVSVELNQGNGWNQVALLEKYEGQFSYPSNELNALDQFRIGLTIPNFNGETSRVSEFIVTVD